MGSATIDLHSQKEHTEIHEIPSLVLIGLVLTEIQAFKNVKKLQRKCMEMRTNPDNCQTWGFCKSRCALSDYVDQ